VVPFLEVTSYEAIVLKQSFSVVSTFKIMKNFQSSLHMGKILTRLYLIDMNQKKLDVKWVS